MESKSLSFMVENGLNLQDVITTGSILHINQDTDENDLDSEKNPSSHNLVDIIGEPISNFSTLANSMMVIDDHGYVRKKIMEEGGGLPLHDGFTVSVAFAGYWEKDLMPFDMVSLNKPMEVNLMDHGLLPGLEIAIKSMLVGEVSLFLLSYQVMYGEIGIPPRIKPKADCAFYIKLMKSILTPKEGKINFSEPNMFQRVHHEAKLLFSSGNTLYKSKNYMATIQLFRKAVNMLHRCRLADEKEEQLQEKLLRKLYTNLAVCYNQINKPLMACTACNELNRLRSLWNNEKALFQNAKALRVIGAYDAAEKRLKKAMTLKKNSEEMKAEYDLLIKTRNATLEAKAYSQKAKEATELVSDIFKQEVDDLIRNFKTNDEEDQIILPSHFNSDEMEYFKEVCIRENLFFNTIENVDPPTENGDHSESEVLVDLIFRKNA